jgi:hypothetical protein
MTGNAYIVLADNPADGSIAAQDWGGADFTIFTGPGRTLKAAERAKQFQRQGYRNVRIHAIDAEATAWTRAGELVTEFSA